MEAEFDSIGWSDLVPRKVLGVKLVFKTKNHIDGSLDEYKARIVAKDYAQCPYIDYGNTFAPTSRMATF